MPRLDIDMELIALAKQGEQKAYTALFKYYYRWVYHFVRGMIRCADDAKDITMLTFAKAFRRLDLYEPTNEFRTWLFTIARYTTIDFIKANNVRPHDCMPIEWAYDYKANILNPEQQLISKQTVSIMEKAITQLPADQREILDLRYNKNLLCKEIAQQLHISINTVMGRIRYARKNLKHLINDL